MSCRRELEVFDQTLLTYRRVDCLANKIADVYDRRRDIPRVMIRSRNMIGPVSPGSRAVN